MSIKKEGERGETCRFTDVERDFDIHTLSNVNSGVDGIPGSNFIVTGSYAVEALTNASLAHDDMDSNVFSDDVTRDLPQIATMLEEQDGFILHKRTDDRLEYDVKSDTGLVTPRRLEIQFIEADSRVENEGIEFSQDHNFVVPTAKVSLMDSNGSESILRVKSLPYLIATWTIRISGVVKNQKREVRDSDLEHLRLLLAGDYKQEDVISAMRNHPQMPQDVDIASALTKASNILQ